jgi:hypothetical protein
MIYSSARGGSPTYNFCCVVDDLLMKISRHSETGTSNTHRQIRSTKPWVRRSRISPPFDILGLTGGN